MSSAEFEHWKIYDRLQHKGMSAGDLFQAQIALLGKRLAEVLGASNATLEHFTLPKLEEMETTYRPSVKPVKQSAISMRSALLASIGVSGKDFKKAKQKGKEK